MFTLISYLETKFIQRLGKGSKKEKNIMENSIPLALSH